jgi:molybdopterin molybdotransferase
MGSELLSYEQAAALVATQADRLIGRKPAVEFVELAAAAGRVLAAPLCADRDQPPFARSTRDGYACRAAEASAHELLPVAGATRAGQVPAGPLPAGAAWEIMTGAAVPVSADAVAMLEHIDVIDGQIRLHASRTLACGENVVPQGAEACAGDELLQAGTRLGPAQIALAAACGTASVPVFARPRVAILATGDELVPVEAEPAPGQIRNSNGPMLAALVAVAGAEPWLLPAVADNDVALNAAIALSEEADMLLISGGVSAGKFDLVEEALARAGARFHFTGVRIQPGKPVVFGERPVGAGSVLRTQPIFGLPGNPISTAVTFLLFAAPLLSALGGCREPGSRFTLAQLGQNWEGKPGLTRFLPAYCTFGPAAGRLPEVTPVRWQGSGDLAAFARCNCFLVVPEDAGSLAAGAIVSVLLF